MGTPIGLSLGLVIITSVSYLIEIISLGVWLVASITAGYLLAIISGFVWEMAMSEWSFLGWVVILFYKIRLGLAK